MLKITIIILVISIVLILIYAQTRPNSFRIERSMLIHSTPEKIFPHINNFHQWESWSPWEKIDPQILRTYSGSAEAKGAVYEWSGNKNIGKGRMEIIDSVPSTKVTIKLDFITPFEAHNSVDFVLKAQGNGTLVTQAMYGPSPFISKLMGIFFSMEKMVGAKYEEGLAKLKEVVEK